VSEVSDAIAESAAIRVFVTNLMTQPGETDGYDAQRHLTTVKEYAPQIRFDYILLNDRPITDVQAVLYAADGAHQVRWERDVSFGPSSVAEIIRADLLEEGDMVRHNPERLARAVITCAEHARMTLGV